MDNPTGSTTSTGTPSHIDARLVATLNKRAEQEGKQAGIDLVGARNKTLVTIPKLYSERVFKLCSVLMMLLCCVLVPT